MAEKHKRYCGLTPEKAAQVAGEFLGDMAAHMEANTPEKGRFSMKRIAGTIRESVLPFIAVESKDEMPWTLNEVAPAPVAAPGELGK